MSNKKFIWNHIRFDLEYSFLPHIVQDELLDLYLEHVSKAGFVKIREKKEEDIILIDPGGMVMMNGPKTILELSSGHSLNAHNEHLIWLVNFYFNDKINDFYCNI